MGSASRRQPRRSSRRGKWGFSSKDRKESNSTEARTENAGGTYQFTNGWGKMGIATSQYLHPWSPVLCTIHCHDGSKETD